MKYDKNKAIDIIVKAAANYKKCLLDKTFLHELLYHNCMIGDFIDSGICIKADYFVGNTKAILSVGFRFGKNVDIPVTLYKEDVRKLSQPTNKVLAIFVKDYKKHSYTECTYLSRGQKLAKLLTIEEIGALVQAETESVDNGIKSK